MKYVRGLVFFKNKSLSEVRKQFKELPLGLINFTLSKNYLLNSDKLDGVVMLLSGKVEDDTDFDKFKKEFKKAASNEIKIQEYDISISNDDFFEQIIPGGLTGNYISIRINPPYHKIVIEDLAQDIANILAVKDVLLRETHVKKEQKQPDIQEIHEEAQPTLSLDIITDEDTNLVLDEATRYLENNNINISDEKIIIEKLK